MAEAPYPPQSAIIALVLSAILAISTLGYVAIYRNNIAHPTTQPSTPAPDENTKAP
jgi:hypothetical protein